MLASTCGAVPEKSMKISVACNPHRDVDAQGLRILTDAVDPVDEAVVAVGKRRDLRPHQPLAQALQLVGVGVSRRGAVPANDLGEPALARAARCDLRTEIAENLHGLTRVLGDHLEERGVLLAGIEQLQERHPQTPPG